MICNFASHGVCIDFDNQQMYYLINFYFFVTSVGQPKSVVAWYLGTFLDFPISKNLRIIIRLYILLYF